jgi:hypothetical protein
VHSSRPPGRAGVLLVATALVAVLVAAPSASAATFGGGSEKFDVKQLKGVKLTPKGQSAKSGTSATFPFADEAGTVAPMGPQASGNLNLNTSASMTLTRAKKKLVLGSIVQKIKAGKGIVAAKIGGKGPLVDIFDVASANRITADSGFTTLSMQTANLTLTKAGAAAFNKAFGLKGKSNAYKAKGKVGTASFTADRLLEFGSGQSNTAFDPVFFDKLKNDCGIDLKAVGTAQVIGVGDTAPRGGAVLNVVGGTMNAKTLSGTIQHDKTGGTALDRPAGTGKGDPYHTEILDYLFALDQTPFKIRAYSTAVVNTVEIGTFEGTPAADLTDTGGTVTIPNGVLRLSDAAGTLLKIQTGCDIPPSTTLATTSTTANVK